MKETKCIITDDGITIVNGCMRMMFDGKEIVVESNKPTTNFSVGELKCNVNISADDFFKEAEAIRKARKY